jgi:hypothetical protein
MTLPPPGGKPTLMPGGKPVTPGSAQPKR